MEISRRSALRDLSAAAVGGALHLRMPAPQTGPAGCASRPPRGFESRCFTDSRGVAHTVFIAGTNGPPVLLLHELPGLIDADLAAARRFACEGFRLVVPLMFGEPGGTGDWRRFMREVCGKDRFACREGDITSPEVAWLRELAAYSAREWPEGNGAGVIGMCLTGAFPLAMLREPSVVAPVLLQPTIPFHWHSWLPWFTDNRALGVSRDDLAHAKTRSDVPLLGIRYRGDWRSRHDRFDRLSREFPDRFHRLDLPGRHHSTIGGDFCEAAFLEVLSFLNQRLRRTPDPALPFPTLSRLSPKEVTPGGGCRATGTHHQEGPTC